jgi:hypothetical protein
MLCQHDQVVPVPGKPLGARSEFAPIALDMDERGLFPECPLWREDNHLATLINKPFSQFRDVWRNRMGFVGIDNVSTTELKEHLRPDVFVCIFHSGQSAATSSHVQAYSVIHAVNPESRRKIAELAGGDQ